MESKTRTGHEEFVLIGKQTDTIDVRISHRIIQLFSEGLYSSSNKAVEELVSNSFDAGAQNVHVILSPDLRSTNATIVVIDDGEGMDIDGLKQHWIIGRSTRRRESGQVGRRPIGKFGIGKLATYVLAAKLTHICKVDGRYYAATMDYTKLEPENNIEQTSDETSLKATSGVFNDDKVSIPLRELSRAEAQSTLGPWITGSSPGYQALDLFGDNAPDSWTVAIMSTLTEMGKKIRRGRLRWILRTAMPLRDDFKLYLDGTLLESSKIDMPLIQKWIIGKDVTNDQLRSPCPDDLEPTEDENVPSDSLHRFGLSHEELGRITGYFELFDGDLTSGKSDDIERSNGFFVYVLGRMINTDDPGFGIRRNLLRHGTFSRFRMVVHIDSLDEVLRSSRETFLQEGGLYQLAQNFLHACFNLARNRLVQYEQSQSPGARIAARISSAPGSLTRKPILALAQRAIWKQVTPLYTRVPENLTDTDKNEFLERLQKRSESKSGLLRDIEHVELHSTDGIAIYDLDRGILQINTGHPFVAAFQDSFTKSATSLPLEMYAMAEVLTEAHLYHMMINESTIRDILSQRDELLRYLVRTSARRTPGMISIALMDAKDDPDKLEIEMRAAFEAMGFANVIRHGGKDKPDGTAEAYLAASKEGIVQRYKVGLEAKSGNTVSAKRLGVSGLARHMEEFGCDHHIVIGNGFHTSTGEDTASVKEISKHKENEGTTITLMHIDDLARLVRLVPAKRIGLDRLRQLFLTCITPEETKLWIDQIAVETPEQWPYSEILDTIWDRANKRPNEMVEYAAILTALEYRDPPITIAKQALIDCCKAMQVMAHGVFFARENNVEINRRPDLILEDIRSAINEYPYEERRTITI